MRIGTIGAGAVALAVGREALARGHEIVLSSRSGPGALADKVSELGRGASAVTVEEAASLDYVLLAVPWRNVEPALRGECNGACAQRLRGLAVGRQREIERLDGFAMPTERRERLALERRQLGIVLLDLEGALVALQRLLGPALRQQGVAARESGNEPVFTRRSASS